jgi:hypothetical protein
MAAKINVSSQSLVDPDPTISSRVGHEVSGLEITIHQEVGVIWTKRAHSSET